MTIHLIRHGTTEANEKQLYYGWTDLPLSEQGRKDLIALKETGIYENADIYITSGLARADESLQILYGREPDIIVEEFKEMNFGAFEMKSHDELIDDPEYQRFITGGSSAACPGGESRDAFKKRVKAGLKKLYSIKSESIAVICHGGAIVTIMEHYFPGQKEYYEWVPDNGRGYILDIANKRKAEWRSL